MFSKALTEKVIMSIENDRALLVSEYSGKAIYEKDNDYPYNLETENYGRYMEDHYFVHN